MRGMKTMDFSLAGISIQQIMVFLCVAEYEGFAKASDYLHMTQSAVSKSVAKLEKELGIELFQRTTREIHLTDVGKILYHDWKEQVRAMHDSYIRAASLHAEEEAVLSIGLLNTARPEKYFWNLEERFKKEYPGIQLELSSEYMTDLEDKLLAGKYDAIMVPDFERFALERRGLNWKWAACSNVLVIMSENHPLAKQSSLTLRDLLYEEFVTLEHGQKGSYQEDLEERFQPYHVQPKIKLGYKNAYEIQYLFRKDSSVVLLVDDYFAFPSRDDIVQIPLTDQKNGIICAWNPNNQKSSLQKFVGMLRPSVHGE